MAQFGAFRGSTKAGRRKENPMRVLYLSLMMSSLVAAAGCDRDTSAGATSEPATRIVAEELAEPLEAPAPRVEAPPAAPRSQPVARRAPAPEYRPVETVYAPPQPRVVETTNIKRDAAIGAGIGAVVGAVAHRPNRIKGAIVGGVIGGAAGAVVGATIDKSTRVIYP
jgi:hypothetical protein